MVTWELIQVERERTAGSLLCVDSSPDCLVAGARSGRSAPIWRERQGFALYNERPQHKQGDWGRGGEANKTGGNLWGTHRANFPSFLFTPFFLKRPSWRKSVSPWPQVCALDVDEWADIHNSAANNSRYQPLPFSPKQETNLDLEFMSSFSVLMLVVTVRISAVNNFYWISYNVLRMFMQTGQHHRQTYPDSTNSKKKKRILWSHFCLLSD